MTASLEVTAGVTLVDWRSQADYRGLMAGNGKSARALFRAGKVVMRPPADVVGIMWHVTACLFGVSPAAVREAGGDAKLARDRRALRIPAHATVFRDGHVVVPFDLLAYLWHGNGGNAASLGVEIESDDGSITPEQVIACRWLARWFVAEARKVGATIRETWAHRQTNGIKPNDPGPVVWREVAIPSSEELGLTRTIRGLPGSTPAVKHGLPIPLAWDPLGT
jgi:hypothetical protein